MTAIYVDALILEQNVNLKFFASEKKCSRTLE